MYIEIFFNASFPVRKALSCYIGLKGGIVMGLKKHKIKVYIEFSRAGFG